ncbi:MAG: (S)-ureidoglycine aminohydrolase [Verrucomicrobia bacterium]|nr:MAG: (S)-ureidoglycine aminohydrolase [Verrucomicrobiota bacterium]
MSELFGFSRTVVKERYALITPDGFVPSLVPGWKNAVVVVNISPVIGARFAQLHVTLAADGACEGNTGKRELFIYVIEGSASVLVSEKRHRLEAGSYAYIPPGKDMQLKSSAANTRLVVFEKIYQPLAGQHAPAAVSGHEREIKGEPFLGNNDARLQVLLPDNPQFDLAVNIFTYQPGATLPFVETHIMEHGLLMLKGQGVYRLDADHHPVKAGDVIWMASYCPQWFVAMGKTPASYIYYKDVNRDPLA